MDINELNKLSEQFAEQYKLNELGKLADSISGSEELANTIAAEFVPSPQHMAAHAFLDYQEIRSASVQCEFLLKLIKDYESKLNNETEVAIKLTSFGQSITMAVTTIGYRDPELIIFEGYVNDSPSILVQHINQLSFMLMTIKKEPDKPVRRIGFNADWAELE